MRRQRGHQLVALVAESRNPPDDGVWKVDISWVATDWWTIIQLPVILGVVNPTIGTWDEMGTLSGGTLARNGAALSSIKARSER